MLYDGSTSNNTIIGDGTVTGTWTVGDYTFPEDDGTNLQVLKTDGNGLLSSPPVIFVLNDSSSKFQTLFSTFLTDSKNLGLFSLLIAQFLNFHQLYI